MSAQMNKKISLEQMYLADYVKRWHNKPQMPTQTNGQHLAGMLTLCIALHPNPSAELIIAIINHDKPEYWTGDFPHTAKAEHPELKAIDQIAAEEYLEASNQDRQPLSEIDSLFLRYLDQLEPLMFVNAFGDKNQAQINDVWVGLKAKTITLKAELLKKGFVFNEMG